MTHKNVKVQAFDLIHSEKNVHLIKVISPTI